MKEKKLLDEIINIALKAGERIMVVYKRDFAVEYKEDESPLTEADKLSNAVICKSLEELDEKYPILSEENKLIEYDERKKWKRFWLVDPIDGTKEFIKKNGEFTVNIALIEDGKPVMGVVYAPALETLYFGMKDYGAFKRLGRAEIQLPEAHMKGEKLRVVASRSHLNEETENFIKSLELKYPKKELDKVSKGSSLKLCMVAEGSADVYPRVAPTMEWDTAAAQAVVEAAGFKAFVFDSVNIDELEVFGDNDFEPLVYNKEDLLNPYFIVV
jgi:3'(2'), 5'-bisphosphate nucleotidase